MVRYSERLAMIGSKLIYCLRCYSLYTHIKHKLFINQLKSYHERERRFRSTVAGQTVRKYLESMVRGETQNR